ncbi:unnamed protein product [Dracunculus medinensis]|uniref:UV excision repair protein RAD23 n=1 Tax=Dracunculus medinensis TaxID=318479 RepID=A0A0N4UNU2_DRAME|nr:unnamed protein product [Dracunculus medinensis]
MLVTFKTVSQVTFRMDVNEKQSIGELKKKISIEQGENDYPVENLKLIYNGKVLDDEQILEDVKVDPAKFVVVMVSRKKPLTAAVATASSETTGMRSEPSQAEGPIHTTAETTTTTTASSILSTGSTARALTLTPEQEQTVEAIIAMGYSRDKVIRALRASFFNGDRAVEYLCSSIPDEEDLGLESETIDSTENSSVTSQTLEFLRQIPQFEHLREIIQSDPSVLPQVIEQIAQSNPSLMEAIQNNQEEFINLLNAPAVLSAAGQADSRSEEGLNRNYFGIEITRSEQDAINRLKAMGFPEQLVIEAYFSCDKNEDLAVNYILQRMEEAADELNAALDNSESGGQ